MPPKTKFTVDDTHLASLQPMEIGTIDANPQKAEDFVRDPGLRQRVHDLPPEVYRVIADCFFQACFGPRRVSPQYELFTSNVFEALNRELYDKYWNMFWSENTWVIGTEKADSTVKILSKIPAAVLHLVRKVELRYAFLGIESRDSLAHYFFDENGKERHHNVLDLMRCFQWESQRIWSRTMRLWFENLKIIVTLRLDDLVLDLSQAYAPDGEYVGVSAIAGSPRFRNGLPANLQVLAPTQILVDRIRAILERKNS